MSIDRRKKHRQQTSELSRELVGNTQHLRVKKKTISNLFRYEPRHKNAGREVDLRKFNQPLYLDKKAWTLEVQGLATFETIVDFVLPHGFIPVITPELKHITVGGATVGIGIETNSFRHGFVHDSLLEADVLLPDGRVVTCQPDNEHSDLFYGLPNSYGTLGYILRVKIKLLPAKPYVQLHTQKCEGTAELVHKLKNATRVAANDSIESLVYSKDEMYLTTSRQVDTPGSLTSIYGKTVFYQEISRLGDITLTMRDFLFRYDPEWFWVLPLSAGYDFYRKLAPKKLRNSSFFNRVARWKTAINNQFEIVPNEDDKYEYLIQDWEVPWKHGQSLLDFALDNLDLCDKPLLVAPLKTPAKATGYPIKNSLYLNLGSYNFVRKKPGQPKYHNTKIMDEFCFGHDGIKMLYSTTFLDEKDFNRIYDGATYAKLKSKYDPKKLLPTLYDKAVKGS